MKKEQGENTNKHIETSLDSLFFQLFMSHQKSFYAFILASVHNYSDTEDLLQESATVMWRKFSDFEQGTDFFAWGLSIIRYNILTFFNERKRSRIQFSDNLLKAITETTTAKLATVDRRFKALQQCCKKLSEHNQYLIHLRYDEGLTVKKIAEKIGKPVQGLYKTMARIQDALQKCIARVLATGNVRL